MRIFKFLKVYHLLGWLAFCMKSLSLPQHLASLLAWHGERARGAWTCYQPEWKDLASSCQGMRRHLLKMQGRFFCFSYCSRGETSV